MQQQQSLMQTLCREMCTRRPIDTEASSNALGSILEVSRFESAKHHSALDDE